MQEIIKGVYCLTCIENGKRYVGVSTTNFHGGILGRWRKYKNLHSAVKKQPKLYNALKKHGPENFKYEVILETDDRERANRVEKQLIALWNLQDIRYGYNIANGGDTKTASKETIEKMSKLMTGREYKQEWKDNASKSHKERFKNGAIPHNKGKRGEWSQTAESKKLISLSSKKLWENEEYRSKQLEWIGVPENNPMFGKHHKDSTKQLISLKNKGKGSLTFELIEEVSGKEYFVTSLVDFCKEHNLNYVACLGALRKWGRHKNFINKKFDFSKLKGIAKGDNSPHAKIKTIKNKITSEIKTGCLSRLAKEIDPDDFHNFRTTIARKGYFKDWVLLDGN